MLGLGSKPKKVYVFISYRSQPPTQSEREKIESAFSKGKTSVVLVEPKQLPEEHWIEPADVRDAYLAAEGSVYLAQNGIGIGGKPKYKTREMGGFLVTTASGDID